MRFIFQKGAWASKSARKTAAQMTPDTVERIAVIRHAALGDMVITRPFLIELRRLFPNAKITLSLVSKYQHGVPEDLVDAVHVQYGSDRKDVSLGEQIRRARELGPQDIIFDLAATPRSMYLCLLTRARLKIGFPYHAVQRLFYDATVLRTDFKYEGEVMLDMLHMFGHVSEMPLRFDLPGDKHDGDREYIIYFNGASLPQKCWPMDNMVQLITELAGRYPGYQHLLLEGKGKWEAIDEPLAALQNVDNVDGLKGLRLEPTVARLKGARLVVSNDTGIRHLAIAAGVPTVGIFQPINPYRYWPRCGPHEVVFSIENEWPSTGTVAAAVAQLLDKLDAAP
jgi:ADP-heptose:LPS heptosyltransferase